MIGLFFGGLLKRLIRAATALFGIIGRYPWQAAVIALLAVSAWLWRGWGNEQDAHQSGNAIWAGADKINRASIASLLSSFEKQNAAIKDLGDKSAARQAAARTAFKGATARGVASEASAARIDRERALRPSGGTICPSGWAVMESRGEL